MTLDPLRFVKFYATVKHGDQKYGTLPYTFHLAAVDAVGVRFGVTDIDERSARWLHDVIEDCGVKRKELAEMFGERVAELVWAVTNEPGENRKVKAALTYPKTRSVVGGVALKLDDRIANVEQGGNLVSMYRREYEDFRRHLYTPGDGNEPRWKHLESLLVVDEVHAS